MCLEFGAGSNCKRRSSDNSVGKRLPVQFARVLNHYGKITFDDEEQDSDKLSLSEESNRADSDDDGFSSTAAGTEPENANAQILKVRSDSESRIGCKEPVTKIRRVLIPQALPAGLMRFRKGVRKTMLALRFKRKEPDAYGVCVKDVSTRAKQRYSGRVRTITDQRELDFLHEVSGSLPILLNETSWLVEVFTACNNFEGRAPARHVCNLIAKSMYSLKMLTARYCWARHVEPIREELRQLSEKHEKLQRTFNTARSSFLLDVSSLRNEVQTRADGNLAANMSQISAFSEAQGEDDLRKLNKELGDNRLKVAKLEKEAEVAKLKSFTSSSTADDKNGKLLKMQVGKLKQQLKETTLEGEHALAVAQADIATKIRTIEVMMEEIMEMKKAAADDKDVAMLNVGRFKQQLKETTLASETALAVAQADIATKISTIKALKNEIAEMKDRQSGLEGPRCVSRTPSANETAIESEELINCSAFQHAALKQEAPCFMRDDVWRAYREADGIERSDLSKQSLGTLRNVTKLARDNVVNAVPQEIWNCMETSPEEGAGTSPRLFQPLFRLSAEHAAHAGQPLVITTYQPPQEDTIDISVVAANLPKSPKAGSSLPTGAKRSMPFLRRGRSRVPTKGVTRQPPQKDTIEISVVVASLPESPEAGSSLLTGAMPSLRKGRSRVPANGVTRQASPRGIQVLSSTKCQKSQAADSELVVPGVACTVLPLLLGRTNCRDEVRELNQCF